MFAESSNIRVVKSEWTLRSRLTKVKDTGLCEGEPPPDSPGGDHSAGPWQRTGAVAEGDPAHPEDTLRRALQPR